MNCIYSRLDELKWQVVEEMETNQKEQSSAINTELL